MPIVGFSIDRINVEKKDLNPKGNINIKNNVAIKDIKERELSLGDTKKDGLKFDFEFSLTYDPDIGNILFNGHVLYLEEEKKKTKEILDNWKKDKKLPTTISPNIINTIMSRCTIKSLLLAQEVNLPPHITLPRVVQKTDVSSYIG